MTDNPDPIPRTADEIQSLLARPFRPEVIRSRKIAGKQVAYLPTSAVRERLTKACNTWDFRIVDRRFEPLMLSRWNDQLKKSEYREIAVYTVVGELEIPELGARQAIGLQEMDEGSGADLLQGAASDALKKAAKLFGVTIDEAPGNDRVEQSRPAAPQRPPANVDLETGEIREPARVSAPANTTGPAGEEATIRQRNLIGSLARELRIDLPTLNRMACDACGRSVEDLTRKGASAVIERLKAIQAERTLPGMDDDNAELDRNIDALAAHYRS